MPRRFHDSGYVNWLKVGQALICMVEGIYDLCDVSIKKYHRTVHQKFPGQPMDDGSFQV